MLILSVKVVALRAVLGRCLADGFAAVGAQVLSDDES